MIIETLRIVADALANQTYGVNAQLPLVPLDGSDPVPSNVVTIEDETRNFDVALNKAPTDDYPQLLVALNNEVEMQGQVVSSVRESTVEVIIQYVALGVQTDTAIRDGYYTMRAVTKCITDLFDNANESARTRNGVHAQELMSMRHGNSVTYEQDAKVSISLILTILVRDVAL